MKLMTVVTLALLGTTSVVANDTIEALTGFYAVDAAACLQPKGMLLLCNGNTCLRQDYQNSVPLNPEVTTMQGTVATETKVDAFGFNIQAGDVTFRFNRGGSSNVQVVRADEATLQTTYLARVNNGKAGFAFIADGVSKDPSASAAPLQICPAYSANAAQWDAPPAILAAAAEAPKPEDWVGLDRALGEIELRYEAPRANAWVSQVVPVTLDDPEYPALFMFWVFGVGGEALPLQVLTYDHAEHAYVDTTADQFKGEIPKVDWASGITVEPIGVDGRMGILIAATGMDAAPFPRTMNTLLLRNKEGKFVDRSVLLPRELHFSHDTASGVIDEAGNIGIYINNMYVPEYYVGTGDGKLIDRRAWLPDLLQDDEAKFAVSGMADLNGDGEMDLVLGSQDSTVNPAVYYMNDGTGRFDRSEPVLLPEPTLNQRELPITKKVVGAIYNDIQAIKLDPTQTYDDLVVVTSIGYAGYAVQILKNDGNGNLTDVTAEIIDGDETTYFKNDATPFSHVGRTRVFQHEGQFDILVKGQATVPSFVYRNNGEGFTPTEAIFDGAIENAAVFGGTSLLIKVATDEVALTAYPE